MTIVRWAGVVLLVGSLIPLAGWTVWDQTRTWNLAPDTPISLAEGSHFSTGASLVNMNARYGIVIYVSDGGVDQFNTLHDQLECQMGVYSWPQGPTSVLSPRCKQPPLLRARWVLTSEEGAVVGDSEVEHGAEGYHEPSGAYVVGRAIGYFHTRKGHHYKLDVDVLSDSKSLDIYRPRISVGVADSKVESYAFMSGIARIACIATAVLGLCLLLGSFIAQRRTVSGTSGNRDGVSTL